MKNAINGTDTEAEAEFTTLGVAALGVVSKLRDQKAAQEHKAKSAKHTERDSAYGERGHDGEIENDPAHGIILVFALRRTR